MCFIVSFKLSKSYSFRNYWLFGTTKKNFFWVAGWKNTKDPGPEKNKTNETVG